MSKARQANTQEDIIVEEPGHNSIRVADMDEEEIERKRGELHS